MGPINAITLSRIRTPTPSDRPSWAETATRLPFPGAPRALPTVAPIDPGPRGGFAQPQPLRVVIPPKPVPAPATPPAVQKIGLGWAKLPVTVPVRTLAPAPAPIPPAPPKQAAPRPPSWSAPKSPPTTPKVAGWSKPAPVAVVRPAIANAVTAKAAVKPVQPKVAAQPVQTFQGARNFYSPAALRQDAIQRQAAATAITTTKPTASPPAKPIGPQTGLQAVVTGKPAVTASSGKAGSSHAGSWKLLAAGVALVAIAAHLSR